MLSAASGPAAALVPFVHGPVCELELRGHARSALDVQHVGDLHGHHVARRAAVDQHAHGFFLFVFGEKGAIKHKVFV